MLYRITLAVDVEAASIQDAQQAAEKPLQAAKQTGGSSQAGHVTRSEVKASKVLE